MYGKNIQSGIDFVVDIVYTRVTFSGVLVLLDINFYFFEKIFR